ncbi:hypothetical protein AHMF7605_01495 [Adhaeribacter arboris]|uniref:Uncharacterized protein n=1 Tax=Adhaeribacter arboris TaxID=2072846 RepID=A0A2T2Y9V7_9BACT|nr:hypothetical protein [Adhaeribacter arboris]PSR52287.1 hypothetical protein AHMF7605_01495 [Adhaeribacter arboris]
MKQREVTDPNNTTWTCVQAYAGLDSPAAEKATDIAETKEGKVPVVCTPSGGAQTVRLELSKNWLEELPDEQLVDEITANQGNA